MKLEGSKGALVCHLWKKPLFFLCKFCSLTSQFSFFFKLKLYFIRLVVNLMLTYTSKKEPKQIRAHKTMKMHL